MVNRFPRLKEIIERFHQSRLSHFREKAKERIGIDIPVSDCLKIENKLSNGGGMYVRSSHEDGQGRELRLIRYKGYSLPVVYQRSDYGLVTCLHPKWELSRRTAKSNKSFIN